MSTCPHCNLPHEHHDKCGRLTARKARSSARKPAAIACVPRFSGDTGGRPAIITEFAREVYDWTYDDPRRDVALKRIGWTFVREVPESRARWYTKDGAEVLVAFGGPRKTARAFSWRPIGGAAERV